MHSDGYRERVIGTQQSTVDQYSKNNDNHRSRYICSGRGRRPRKTIPRTSHQEKTRKFIPRRKEPKIQFDVFFLFGEEEGKIIKVGAHKMILSQKSEVFKAQFFGSMKESEDEIEIVDADIQIFKTFLKMINDDIDVTGLSLHSLVELFYLADKYDYPELREEIIATLKGKADVDDDPLLAVEAAVLAHGYQDMFPPLSDALYDKSVKLILLTFGSINPKPITKMFEEIRRVTTAPGEEAEKDDVMETVVREVLERLEIASQCPNCHNPQSRCLDQRFVSRQNFVPGAKVKLMIGRYCLDGRVPVSLGNPAVHKLGSLNDDNTFSSFSVSGLPLQLSKLHRESYYYNCSER